MFFFFFFFVFNTDIVSHNSNRFKTSKLSVPSPYSVSVISDTKSAIFPRVLFVQRRRAAMTITHYIIPVLGNIQIYDIRRG